jgi:hypothetical protein
MWTTGLHTEAEVEALTSHPAVITCLRDGLRAMNAAAGGLGGRAAWVERLYAESPGEEVIEIVID